MTLISHEHTCPSHSHVSVWLAPEMTVCTRYPRLGAARQARQEKRAVQHGPGVRVAFRRQKRRFVTTNNNNFGIFCPILMTTQKKHEAPLAPVTGKTL